MSPDPSDTHAAAGPALCGGTERNSAISTLETTSKSNATASHLHHVLDRRLSLDYRLELPKQLAVPDTLPPKIFPNSRIYKEIRQLSILTFFAIVGLLGRKGLIALTTYDGSYLSGVAWANFAACVIVGFAIQSASSWAFVGIEKGRTMFYTGVTTGFCGTLSSFCTLMLEVFEKSANISPGSRYYNYPNPAYGIMNGLAVFITQLCLSGAGIKFGKHLARGYDPDLIWISKVESVIAVLGVLSWIAVIALFATIDNWRSWTFACLVSPVACFMRFYCGKWLNPKVKDFPMGTFFVNIFATLVLSALTIANRGKAPWMPEGRIVTSKLTCQVINGLQDGFCGTLSTIATMFVELTLMKEPKNYFYGGVTFSLAYCLIVVFLGSYNWTQGLELNAVCS
ncbi:hypothetical protein WICPIJ_008260 [Wickerhamomyces pijperi]|uniref:Uncharacterized protein n=1 Tax=Wickerhamomyces pijperi TaxID=599730 RepID=A0A9P8PXY1_WICPI|nr:hypothetical protein WICPIJ_008260 [Wickerhamomyces pijperi]